MQTVGSALSVAARERALLIAECRARLWAALEHADRIGLDRGRSVVPTEWLSDLLDKHEATFGAADNGQIMVSVDCLTFEIMVPDPLWLALNRDPFDDIDADPSYITLRGNLLDMSLTEHGAISADEHGVGLCHEGYFCATDKVGSGWTGVWFGSAYAGPGCRIGDTLIVAEHLSRPEFGPDGYPCGDWIDNATGEPIRLDEIDRQSLQPDADLYDAETAERIGPATPAQWWACYRAAGGDPTEGGLFLVDRDGEPTESSLGRKVFVL